MQVVLSDRWYSYQCSMLYGCSWSICWSWPPPPKGPQGLPDRLCAQLSNVLDLSWRAGATRATGRTAATENSSRWRWLAGCWRARWCPSRGQFQLRLPQPICWATRRQQDSRPTRPWWTWWARAWRCSLLSSACRHTGTPVCRRPIPRPSARAKGQHPHCGHLFAR